MLVLSRKVGERILIGDDIRVTIVRIGGGGVRVGIEAPTNLTVVREELKDRAASAQTPAEQATTASAEV
ncbi:MAG TPA: carbon storage regulator CsrA [Pirellulaceae bacterium]|jgi:carbon storage regulator|nr:carbon storage regulator CsrA [Pirellulaceae bacterium]